MTSAGKPAFDFLHFFSGHVHASGWFSDRFGNVKRHFYSDFFGIRKHNTLYLEETFYCSNRLTETRQWLVKLEDNGTFVATSSSVIGEASGLQRGNSLRFAYSMRVQITQNTWWALAMENKMYYQPDCCLHSSIKVSRWGVRIGNISTQYKRHNGILLKTKLDKNEHRQ